MPKRTDIKSILIIGAGPIIIGQACEFDYSGTQACKALSLAGPATAAGGRLAAGTAIGAGAAGVTIALFVLRFGHEPS